MNQRDLQGEAGKLLQSMQLVPPREPGDKLRPIDEAAILELSAAGKSQTEIAQIVGCNQSTVSRTLAEWADSPGLRITLTYNSATLAYAATTAAFPTLNVLDVRTVSAMPRISHASTTAVAVRYGSDAWPRSDESG